MRHADTACWDEMDRALWQRLQAHPFERGDGSLDFLAKLARQQGWSREVARAAIEEYRKFCFLAARAGHAVTPSEEVDQVWHLHLTCTRDYWEVFCPRVLGFALHHEGSDGRADTRQRHRQDYAHTLASYQRWFGVAPEALWPTSVRRFDAAASWRWVDGRRYWLLPRPSRPDWRRWTAGLSALVVAPMALALPLNPLDWSGPQFLLLYVTLLLLALGGAWVWRRRLGDNGRTGDASGLGAVEIAYLAGGVPRALDAGVAELMAGGALRWEGERAVRGEQPAPPGLLGDIHTLVVNSQGYAGLQTASRRAGWPLQALQRTLERRGLLLDPDAERRARLLPTLLPLGVALLGVAKLVVGVARAKPIGGLLLLVIVTLFAAWRFAAGRVARSRAGDRALAQLRQRHAHATRAPREKDLALAVALAGTSALAGTAYAAYHDVRSPGSGSAGSSSDSGSGCSSDSGGSCSSGCGGCGGGD